ncbi:MAG TPA: toll/interleukin-1 receptor domain-containing protein [Pyrinomonadaceae bacterium]|nr:toll/interleukin-1 receptor domain-containing protein [Pyrinomonadaceae bacterium]
MRPNVGDIEEVEGLRSYSGSSQTAILHDRVKKLKCLVSSMQRVLAYALPSFLKEILVNPKVFVSHAGEDKERFVLNFSARLRACGIDAWVDQWEMLPGDSIVDKIFEEGIKSAQAVIVILSRYSVNKKWVREELNVAFIKRINSGSKLIPIVIDECVVPKALESTVWGANKRSFELRSSL